MAEVLSQITAANSGKRFFQHRIQDTGQNQAAGALNQVGKKAGCGP